MGSLATNLPNCQVPVSLSMTLSREICGQRGHPGFNDATMVASIGDLRHPCRCDTYL